MTLAPGSTLGPYTITAELGHGGMGVVYTAHDPRLDRQVAIKLLTADLTRDETATQRFLHEALQLSVVSPLACSGDLYAAVPTVWPVCAGRETPCPSGGVYPRVCRGTSALLHRYPSSAEKATRLLADEAASATERNEEVHMSHRCLVLVFAAVAVVALASVSVAEAQSNASWTVPRTADGQPDLRGVWDFRTLTPLQRPEERSDQAVLTVEQVAEIEAESVQRAAEADLPSDVRTEPLPAGGNVGVYNNFWFDRGAGVVGDRRTSLIIDPRDGRVPPLRHDARYQIGSLGEDLPSDRPIRYRAGGAGVDDPEDRGLGERCILGFNSGPPMLPGGYNQNMQLFQTPDHLVILNEMVHDSRIIPLDGRPHLPGDLRQWMGDGRGYWEGDTLVVETTNFTDKTASFNPSVMVAMGSGTTLRLIERFKRVDADTLSYEYSVYDPTTFTRSFSAEIPMKRGAAPLFEYACHEGNYGLLNILRGARNDELAAAATSK